MLHTCYSNFEITILIERNIVKDSNYCFNSSVIRIRSKDLKHRIPVNLNYRVSIHLLSKPSILHVCLSKRCNKSKSWTKNHQKSFFLPVEHRSWNTVLSLHVFEFFLEIIIIPQMKKLPFRLKWEKMRGLAIRFYYEGIENYFKEKHKTRIGRGETWFPNF